MPRRLILEAFDSVPQAPPNEATHQSRSGAIPRSYILCPWGIPILPSEPYNALEAYFGSFGSNPLSSPERGCIAASLRIYSKIIHLMTLVYPHPSFRAILRLGGLFWKPWVQSPKPARTGLHSSFAQELSQDHTCYNLGVSPSLPQGHITPRRPILEALAPVPQDAPNEAT